MFCVMNEHMFQISDAAFLQQQKIFYMRQSGCDCLMSTSVENSWFTAGKPGSTVPHKHPRTFSQNTCTKRLGLQKSVWHKTTFFPNSTKCFVLFCFFFCIILLYQGFSIKLSLGGFKKKALNLCLPKFIIANFLFEICSHAVVMSGTVCAVRMFSDAKHFGLTGSNCQKAPHSMAPEAWTHTHTHTQICFC